MTFSSASDALRELERSQPSVVVSDIRMPGVSGLELLQSLKEQLPKVPVIIMTAYSDLDSAVSAFQGGAFEYLPKPFDVDQALELVRRALAENASRDVPASSDAPVPEILGHAPAMQEVFRAIGRLSQSHATVLITGESGSGKELVAHALHRHSPRAAGPFIALNTAAIPKDLLESELFGHERGAFTGAAAQRRGRFEQADGGTLFLDEIGDMDLAMQAKLLRVLQEREFERVGGNRTIKVNVRVLATTNRNLLKEVEKGNFREDLYYRLNVFPIEVPALRERKEDVMLLADAFLERFSRKHGIKVPGFSRVAAEMLAAHTWPGNVRELQNTIERAVILSENGRPVQPFALGLLSANGPMALPDDGEGDDELFDEAVAVGAPPALGEATANGAAPASTVLATGRMPTLEELEKEHILRVLRETEGKRVEAAEMLAISTRTLRNKINQYRLEGLDIP